MAYQVLIDLGEDLANAWRPYSKECETMAEAYKLQAAVERRRPWRKFKVVNLVNYEVEQWAGREAGDSRD